MKRICLTVLFFILCAVLFAQKKDSLAVFPFTGGNETDGEAIASSLSRQRTLRDAFNKTTLITQSTVRAMNFEHKFQRDSGLTDADSIFELGKKLNASHVISGYITRFGDLNLVLVSIMDVESLQQIAGDYRTYKAIEEVDKLIPDIARKLAAATARDTRALPGLSVPPFNILWGADANDAQVLAQVLSCDLSNGDKYAVLPRTDSLEAVLAEQRRQRDGSTDQDRTRRLGAGRNARYVLSGGVQRLGTVNKFTIDILDINDGSIVDAYEEQYTEFSEGFKLMPVLASKVTGAYAAEQAAAERQRQAAAAAERQRQAVLAEEEREKRQAEEDEEKRREQEILDKQRKKREALERFFYARGSKLWSLGVNAGSSFASSLVIANVDITIPLWRYTFIEAGLDAGFIHGSVSGDHAIGGVDYQSWYPYGRFNLFLPFGGYGGWYLGAGGGYKMSFYKYPPEARLETVTVNTPALDIATGFYIGGGHSLARIGYALRTNFSGFSHSLYVGYTFRFYVVK